MNRYLIMALVGVGLLLGAYAYGRHDGSKLEHDAWETRELDLTAKADKAREDSIIAARNEERGKFAQQTAQSAAYLKESEDALAKKDAVIDQLNAGRKLYVNARCSNSSNGSSPTTTTSTGSNDSTRAELSDADARFLTTFAAECDQVALELGRAQGVIRLDRGLK